MLVTGGTAGIGAAGARRLVDEGAEVFVTGRRIPGGERHPSMRFIQNDASDPEGGRKLLESLPSEVMLDGLWLNAGFADVASVEEADAQFFDRMMNVNVRGPLLQLAALCSRLKEGASVVVTSSTAAYEGAAMASVYAATKGALLSLCRCWASALARRGVRVNALVPGGVATGFRDFMSEDLRFRFETDVAGRTALGRLGSAEEVAAVALFLLSDDAAYVTGSQYFVDGGLTML